MQKYLMEISFYLKNAAFAGGDELMKGFGADFSGKGGRAARASYDIHSSAAIVSALLFAWFAQRKDDVAVVSKEAVTPKIARYDNGGYIIEDFEHDINAYGGPCFCVSGLCGGGAYARGLRDFCVSIAYIEQKKIRTAAVFDPVNVELFHAAAGMGAYLNAKSIRVSETGHIIDACVSVDNRTLRTAGKDALRALSAQALSLRTAEACGLELCYTACGRIDAAVMHDAHFCDCAAGLLIAKEAGAAVFYPAGGAPQENLVERTSIVAACPGIEKELLLLTRSF
ncbi:MAG: hypothetical protein PHO15_04270 [Eubacteriales bacterium]|nr:hypothetical protein [Eubacteriales bacterium]